MDTTTTFAIPNDFASSIPDSFSGNGTIYVDTYLNGNKLGTSTNTFTASVPTNIKPSFTGLTLTDTNGKTAPLLSGNNFLQVLSTVKCTFNGASGVYGSQIRGYYAEIVGFGQSISEQSGVLGIMKFSGQAKIRAYVTDSRGNRSDTKEVTINVIPYTPPTLSFSVLRTRENPAKLQVLRTASVAPITVDGHQKNLFDLKFKVSVEGANNFRVDNGPATQQMTTQSSLNNSAANLAGDYSPSESFEVIGVLSDRFTSVEIRQSVSTENVIKIGRASCRERV